MSENDEKVLAEGRRALEGWQTPAEFIAKVEELVSPVKSDKLFSLPSVGFLLDAMILAEFMKLRPSDKVRLVEQRRQWPDGQSGTPQKPIDIEITEVLEEGRKRGDEYREGKKPSDGNVEEWHRRAEAIPAQLEKAIQRKIDKRYAGKCTLLIYLNMSNYGVLQTETEAAIAAVKFKYVASFDEINILWQGKCY